MMWCCGVLQEEPSNKRRKKQKLPKYADAEDYAHLIGGGEAAGLPGSWKTASTATVAPRSAACSSSREVYSGFSRSLQPPLPSPITCPVEDRADESTGPNRLY